MQTFPKTQKERGAIDLTQDWGLYTLVHAFQQDVYARLGELDADTLTEVLSAKGSLNGLSRTFCTPSGGTSESYNDVIGLIKRLDPAQRAAVVAAHDNREIIEKVGNRRPEVWQARPNAAEIEKEIGTLMQACLGTPTPA